MAAELERKRWKVVANGAKPTFHIGAVIIDTDTGAQWLVENVERKIVGGNAVETISMVKGSFTKGEPRG